MIGVSAPRDSIQGNPHDHLGVNIRDTGQHPQYVVGVKNSLRLDFPDDSLNHPFLIDEDRTTLMFILLLASLLGASAFPISGGPETNPTMAHTIIWGIQARGDGSGMVERTMLSIVRSCLLTVAACVYRAIHQNIPDPEAGWWKRQAIRAKITFFALMAPEAIIFWAMRQWFGAKEVADQINGVKPELKWTRTHGHFAQMGGFERLDNRRVLHPPTLIALLKDGQIDVEELERVSTKRINDCSKGDILSKGIVALQTTWFVFECLARLHQGLPLLELEVVTLAFAVLNTVTYAFWWQKPLNVLCPIHLHILPPPEAPNTPPPVSEPTNSPPPTSSESLPSDQAVNLGSTGENSPLLDSSVVEVKEKREGDGVIHGAWKAVVEGMVGPGKSVSRVVKTGWEWIGAVGKAVKKDIKKRPWWKTVWKRLIKGPFLAVVGPLNELLDDDEVHDDATHISTFYALAISAEKDMVVFFSSCFIGMIFGAIHFLPWHSAFPTHTQLLLWRISSIVLVAEPFCLALEGVLNVIGHELSFETWREGVASTLAIFIYPISFLLGPIAYILARIALLVLAFLALRNSPSTALQTISWTTYIPHL